MTLYDEAEKQLDMERKILLKEIANMDARIKVIEMKLDILQEERKQAEMDRTGR